MLVFGWSGMELYFYGGIIVMVCSVILWLIAAAALHMGKRRLHKKLEEEYGSKRH